LWQLIAAIGVSEPPFNKSPETRLTYQSFSQTNRKNLFFKDHGAAKSPDTYYTICCQVYNNCDSSFPAQLSWMIKSNTRKLLMSNSNAARLRSQTAGIENARAQLTDEALSLSRADHDMAYWVALTFALLGEKDLAFKCSAAPSSPDRKGRLGLHFESES
jgi:hypothetical protein